MKTIKYLYYIPVCLLAACGSNQTEKAAPQGLPEKPAVKLITLKLEPVSNKLNLTGEIIPFDRANIYARTPGYVKEVKVDIGSKVSKGQVLCILDAPELKAAQAQSQSNSMGTKSKYESSKSTYLRLLKAAQTPGAVADNEMEIARNQMRTDSAVYQASRSATQATGAIQDYLVIRSPFNGVVTARNVFKGDFVDNTGKTLLFRVEDNSSLRVDVAVPEAYNSTTLKDNEASFTVSANPGQIFKAKLARKSDAIDPQTRSETWELTFPNANGLLKPGMFAQIVLPVSRPKDGFLVPFKAVVTTQERKFVIRVENGKTKWVDVKTGFTGKEKTEIAGDLKPGDQLVAQANEELKEGTTVQVKQ
ncbi:MAG: efflux RND transporter periplasmic adaptor subunit [Bacteroidota bacterium]|uniref:efflux RND transporter periplasmic adaptor subunit n=1 Tax=Mucilaginibacter inviolabilis TaxID=2714892 RepID=UPI001408881D|nr:efflux RND transporter periplasmic adaptor subunit [Mucilaginibacter inviolabilis]NHA05871.1 efflux RND transporter periplasmic adaptor subunit [Mucilaginibacter inviolabilis]